ncbi:MAG: galactosyltransferase-related protein [Clostridia bacterium]|nr:galactosyltransferase-related protein [Clostridia bacterium]
MEHLMEKISVLIPYKAQNDNYREFLWSTVKRRYELLMPELEICLGTDDSQVYNRARAVNNAAKKASGDIFLITDADVIFNKSLLGCIIDGINNFPWVVPFTKGYKLSRTVSEKLIAEGIPEIISVQESDAESIIRTAGPLMNAVSRENFEKIRGMDERFEGWGGEDDAMRISLDVLCGPSYRIEGEIYHLWHPPAPVYRNYYINNLYLLKRYLEATADKNKMIELINEKVY